MNSRLFSMRPLLRAARYSHSAKYSTLPSEAVVFADDGTIVCWHPEQPFPYECSKPLPESKPASDSVLKIGKKEAMAIFKQKHPDAVRAELSRITFTTKHLWFPRSRDKRAKNTPPDREYL